MWHHIVYCNITTNMNPPVLEAGFEFGVLTCKLLTILLEDITWHVNIIISYQLVTQPHTNCAFVQSCYELTSVKIN